MARLQMRARRVIAAMLPTALVLAMLGVAYSAGDAAISLGHYLGSN